jgi:rRNA-processing protein FCF1
MTVEARMIRRNHFFKGRVVFLKFQVFQFSSVVIFVLLFPHITSLLSLRALKQNSNIIMSVVIVLDTNMFMEEKHPTILNTLKELYDGIQVVIPFTVMQELDILKTSPNTKQVQLAKQAIFHIHDMLVKNRHPWIRGQNPTLEYLAIPNTTDKQTTTSIRNSQDDCILECVHYLVKLNEASDTRVVLLTRDFNLQIKCKCLNITATDLPGFKYVFYPRNDQLVDDVYDPFVEGD